MKKTPTKMADGRELIYYDEDESVIRDNTDLRKLPELQFTSEIRHDPLLDEWVVVASHRQSRTFLPPTNRCPLCATSAENPTEIPASDYDVVVFENRFPSLALSALDIDPAVPVDAGLVDRRPARGRSEVVVFTSDHDRSFSQLSLARVRTVLDVWADRTADLSAMPGIEQVFPFENCGIEIGVTLSHPHGQIYAYPFVTPKTNRMLRSARHYREEKGRNLFVDVLAAERRLGERVVVANDNWTAFVPSAARWPIDLHIYPHRQMPDLTGLTSTERADFAELYLTVLGKLDALYGKRLPYIAGWHQAPVSRDRDLAYLHMELFSVQRAADKLKYLAGSESGMAVWINDATPERIAEMLREAGI
ncbi:MAG: galactose-1-phosphate uridylyltransferase [Acidimicrobiia bacterium]|nr:galactose-1-phosphate uridylyltransferase [Acidimicrobiia bacterium]